MQYRVFSRVRLLLIPILALSLGVSAGRAADTTDDPLFIAQSIAIARRLIVSPPVDLVEASGKILDSDDVVARMNAGEDVSLLNPAPTDVWGGALTSRNIVYPAADADGYVNLRFDSMVTTPLGLSRARVLTNDAAATPYRIAMSNNLHSALMSAELLKRLGYTVDLPRRYEKGRLTFDSTDSRDTYLKELAGRTGTLIEQWLIKTPGPTDLTVEVRDFALEPARIATPTYYWGAVAAKEIQERRVIRALLIPNVLIQIPESINLWTWEIGKVINERVLLFHPFAGNFQGELNYQDGQWISRKIAALSETDLHAIIASGAYPATIEPLLYEKLKSRRNTLMDLFEIPGAKLPVNAQINLTDPETGGKLVENGKLLRQTFPGYGFPFIGRDPDSPLRTDELFRYFKLRGIGTALSAGLTKLNDSFLKFDRTDLTKATGDNFRFVGGPGAKLNLAATRKVTSGTYFGSESQVQLVDQISLTATLAYFAKAQARALPDVTFSFGPNAALSRSYVHVKPLASMQEAIRTPWLELPVITKMKALAKLFGPETDDATALDTAMTAFLNNFLPDENFAIVDSVDLGASVDAAVPLPPVTPIFGSGKLTLSAGYDHLIARRTMLQRQADGTIQVTLQRAKAGVWDFSLTYSFVVDILSGDYARNSADAVASVYVLDPNSTTISKKNLNEALRALLTRNDSTLLEKNFLPYELDHALKSNTANAKFLPWTFAKKHEEHRLEAYPPGAHDAAHRRDLYSLRDRKLTGSDFLGFSSRAAIKAAKDLTFPGVALDTDALGDGGAGADPSSSFLGKSHWHEVHLETELTPTFRPRTQITLQETYTGWTMNRARVLRIMGRFESDAHSAEDSFTTLIHPEEFLSTTKLLLYQITAETRIGGPGLDALVAEAQSLRLNDFRGRLFAEGRIREALTEDWDIGDPDAPYDWVPEFYSTLRKVPAVGTDVESNRARAQRLYDVGKFFASELNADELLKVIGPENAMYQITVTGFRKNDENGDSAYLSNTIGQTNPLVGVGAFAAFAKEQSITPYETNGTYLGDGT